MLRERNWGTKAERKSGTPRKISVVWRDEMTGEKRDRRIPQKDEDSCVWEG